MQLVHGEQLQEKKKRKKKSLSLPFQMDESFHEGAPVKED